MDKGAHFHRTDLQVHTPRDRRWAGTDCVTDDERRTYATDLVRACRDKGLHAIAVTDHHDMAFADFVREAARLEYHDGDFVSDDERLVVFPGMELTLAVPCQALLIFDAGFPKDMFGLAQTALAITPAPNADAKTVQTARLDHIRDLEDLHAELDKHEYLRGRYIVLPNVSEGGGDTLLRRGAAGKYKSMPCVGGYLDGDAGQLGQGNTKILSGKDTNYGSKRLALFQTSDNRSESHDLLGRHSTWVKWAVPTAEALRQACLAQESRISQEAPELPSAVITRVSVSNSAFLGPFELELNAQYNALIGGRGTGKSSILEYVRWALCDQLPDTAGDAELPNYQRRRKMLVEQTLATVNATVEVQFLLNNVAHVVRRNSTSADILLKVGDGEFERRSEADVRALLPIQAYSQKQLSNVSVRLEELTRFIETPIQTALDDLTRRLDRNAAEMRQVYATVNRKRRLTSQLENDELQLRSLTDQAEAVRASLTGLSEADAAVLKAKPLWDKAGEARETVLQDLLGAQEVVVAFATGLADLPTVLDLTSKEIPERDGLARMEAEAAAVVADLKALAAKAISALAGSLDDSDLPRGKFGEAYDAWNARRLEFDRAYEAAKGRASSHETALRGLAALEQRIADMRATIATTRAEMTRLGAPADRLAALRGGRLDLSRDRLSLLEGECSKLNQRSDGEIRATLDKGAGTGALIDKLRATMTGSGLRRDKLDQVRDQVEAAGDPPAMWRQILDELELLAQVDATATEKVLPRTPTLSGCGLSPQDLARFANQLAEETWLEIALTPLIPHPKFEFRAREADYIPFENASAGQQATALLKVLLNQAGPPLIIDQPEEDLDNPVILEVVEQVWRAKGARQLIFASHNANLVVNGDAELVVWCDYRASGDHSRGRIEGQGAIDVPAACEAIKRVMEGGEVAFKLRRDKYGF